MLMYFEVQLKSFLATTMTRKGSYLIGFEDKTITLHLEIRNDANNQSETNALNDDDECDDFTADQQRFVFFF